MIKYRIFVFIISFIYISFRIYSLNNSHIENQEKILDQYIISHYSGIDQNTTHGELLVKKK